MYEYVSDALKGRQPRNSCASNPFKTVSTESGLSVCLSAYWAVA